MLSGEAKQATALNFKNVTDFSSRASILKPHSARGVECKRADALDVPENGLLHEQQTGERITRL